MAYEMRWKVDTI